jgi:hypothetical protein
MSLGAVRPRSCPLNTFAGVRLTPAVAGKLSLLPKMFCALPQAHQQCCSYLRNDGFRLQHEARGLTWLDNSPAKLQVDCAQSFRDGCGCQPRHSPRAVRPGTTRATDQCDSVEWRRLQLVHAQQACSPRSPVSRQRHHRSVESSSCRHRQDDNVAGSTFQYRWPTQHKLAVHDHLHSGLTLSALRASSHWGSCARSPQFSMIWSHHQLSHQLVFLS